MDELARMRPDHHRAGNDARASPADDLHEAVVDLLHLRAGIGGEGKEDDIAADRAIVEILLSEPDGGDLGIGEDRARDHRAVERGDGIAERVPHSDASLHRRDRCEHEDPCAVTGGIDPPR